MGCCVYPACKKVDSYSYFLVTTQTSVLNIWSFQGEQR